jgi:predicted acetyltransferase
LTVELEPVSRFRQATFRNLWQLYLYEFSRLKLWPIPEDGRWPEDDLDGCWTNPSRHPFFVRVDGGLAGFTVVDERATSPLTGAANVRELSELFVIPAYRKKGVGESAALQAFTRFRGKWELRVMAENDGAMAFWRQVVRRHSRDRFEELRLNDERLHGWVLRFQNGDGT